MPRFHFSATNPLGETAQGELVAFDLAAAQRELLSRGLDCVELRAIDDAAPLPVLGKQEAEAIIATLAEVSSSDLPLADGLRAAAIESPHRRLANALHRLAADLDAGHDLEQIMTRRAPYLPEHIRGLILAGTRANRLGMVLEDVVEHQLTMRETRRQILAALGYPCVVLFVTALLLFVMALWIVPQFKLVFTDFDITLLPATQAMIAASDLVRWCLLESGVWLLLSIAACTLMVICWARYRFGNGALQLLAMTIPFAGPMWLWSSAATFLRLLALLLEQGVPLPAALQLVGNSIHNPIYRHVARQLVDGANRGWPLHSTVSAIPSIPASTVPFIHWGENAGQLPAALRTTSGLLLGRIRSRAMLLQSIGPPIIFIFTAFVLGFVAFAMLSPMLSLIHNLG